jgi:hypothetical protein
MVTATDIATTELELTVAKLARGCSTLLVPCSVVTMVSIRLSHWPLANAGLAKDGSLCYTTVNWPCSHHARGCATPAPPRTPTLTLDLR